MRIPRREWGNQAQWAATAPLLAAHLMGVRWALPLALALCAVTTRWCLLSLGSWRSYRVQIRLGFMLVAGPALLPGLSFIAWIPLLGTSAQVLVAYCPMARLLNLMPWNHDESFSVDLLRQVISDAPGDEGIFTLRPQARRDVTCPG